MFDRKTDDLGEHRFSFVDYYIQKGVNPFVYLQANKLTLKQNINTVYMEYPRGTAYNKDQKYLRYNAKSGTIFLDKNVMHLERDVYLYDENSEVRSNKAQYLADSDFFEAQENVKSKTLVEKTKDKVYIQSDKVISWPNKKIANYIGNVEGHIDRARPYEPRVDFKSNTLNIDVNNSYIEMLNNVYLKRNYAEARAIRGEIFLENYNKSLKYYVLYDDVRLVERVPAKNGKEGGRAGGDGSTDTTGIIERRGYAEKLEGLVKEEKIVLTGYPKLIQGKDIVKGNKITFYENSEIVEVNDSSSSFILKKK